MKFKKNKEKILCIHHDDYDGKCGGHIVRRAVGADLYMISYDKNNKLPDIAKNYDKIIIVDFSFKPEVMKTLPKNTLWIDHHISSIKDYNKYKYNVEAVLKNGVAGCILTYKYFNKTKLPKAVELIGRYDVFDLDKEVLDHMYGLILYDKFELWDKIIDGELLEETIKKGAYIHTHVKENNSKICKNVVKTSIDGIPALVLNSNNFSSLTFESLKDSKFKNIYNNGILINYIITDKKARISLYSITDKNDVSTIAKRYGGGGHKKAAGFTTTLDKIPFDI